ncbi:MAG: hypothetical protein R2873_05685 [Caldilineaceae bacterium]
MPAPTAFTARLIGNKVQLTWQDNATSENGYIVERSVPRRSVVYAHRRPRHWSAVSFTDDADLFGGLFQYRVKAVDVSAESSYAQTSVDLETAQNDLFAKCEGRMSIPKTSAAGTWSSRYTA